MAGFSHHRRRIRHRSTAAARIETCEERILLAAPTVVDPNLAVRPVPEGLNSPVSIAFLGHSVFEDSSALLGALEIPLQS